MGNVFNLLWVLPPLFPIISKCDSDRNISNRFFRPSLSQVGLSTGIPSESLGNFVWEDQFLVSVSYCWINWSINGNLSSDSSLVLKNSSLYSLLNVLSPPSQRNVTIFLFSSRFSQSTTHIESCT